MLGLLDKEHLRLSPGIHQQFDFLGLLNVVSVKNQLPRKQLDRKWSEKRTNLASLRSNTEFSFRDLSIYADPKKI